MRQSGESFSDGPEPIQPQRVHGHAPEGCQDLNAVLLAVAVVVSSQLGIERSMPAVVNASEIRHGLQQAPGGASVSTSGQLKGLCTGLPTRIPWLPTAIALALPGQFSTTNAGASR